MANDALQIIYDGDCPFCSQFVALYRIRQNVGQVELIDAREHPDVVADVTRRGYELDDGMIAIWDGRYYYGQESVTLMSMLSDDAGVFARLNRILFAKPAVAKRIYPVMVQGRKMVLRLLGRKLISQSHVHGGPRS